MPTELVLHALEQALTLRQPAPGLIIHADRGSQYTSAACLTSSHLLDRLKVEHQVF